VLFQGVQPFERNSTLIVVPAFFRFFSRPAVTVTRALTIIGIILFSLSTTSSVPAPIIFNIIIIIIIIIKIIAVKISIGLSGPAFSRDFSVTFQKHRPLVIEPAREFGSKTSRRPVCVQSAALVTAIGIGPCDDGSGRQPVERRSRLWWVRRLNLQATTAAPPCPPDDREAQICCGCGPPAPALFRPNRNLSSSNATEVGMRNVLRSLVSLCSALPMSDADAVVADANRDDGRRQDVCSAFSYSSSDVNNAARLSLRIPRNKLLSTTQLQLNATQPYVVGSVSHRAAAAGV